MEARMFFKVTKTFLNEQLKGIGSSRSRKARYATLLVGLTFMTEAHASRKSINEDELFYTLHPRLQRPYQETQQEIEIRQVAALEKQEFQNAFKVINGVIAMYCEDVKFNNDMRIQRCSIHL